MSSDCGDQPGGFAQGPDEKNGRFGFVGGFAAARNAAPATSVSVTITLLAESARRVGTAWPGAVSKEECGGGKAARKIRRDSVTNARAALHNRLKLLESPRGRRRFHPFTALSGRLVPTTGT
jgi:hypothetical protein